MREILFRGKRVDNGEWVYGYYVRLFSGKKNQYSYRIYTGPAEVDCGDYYPDFFEVDPETVGQDSGLTDKNGRKIFEGDIIHIQYSSEFFGEEYFADYLAAVSYKEGCFITNGINNGDEVETPLSGFDNHELEIIGNIHDNNKLLEVKNESNRLLQHYDGISSDR